MKIYFLVAKDLFIKGKYLKVQRLIITFTKKFFNDLEKREKIKNNTGFSTIGFLASKNISENPQPDLRFYGLLLSEIKHHLKMCHFETLDNIQTAVTYQM